MGTCSASWSTGVGDHKTCIKSAGHSGGHISFGGSGHYDTGEEWRAVAYQLARLLERECDVRGVMPDDVARVLGTFQRLEREPLP